MLGAAEAVVRGGIEIADAAVLSAAVIKRARLIGRNHCAVHAGTGGAADAEFRDFQRAVLPTRRLLKLTIIPLRRWRRNQHVSAFRQRAGAVIIGQSSRDTRLYGCRRQRVCS